uniref:Uncharacterized protein n=1 Tax=Rhodomela confervoides TaxID=35163 RepID=A0A1Z1MAE6_RHOCN|nr:hypothetical protein [Rhodomela confervoides]ARW62775.1 hypothetical protein [Rhodomela confervoides]
MNTIYNKLKEIALIKLILIQLNLLTTLKKINNLCYQPLSSLQK